MEDLTRFTEICIPKRPDGTGFVWLRAKVGTIKHWGLDSHGEPLDYPGWSSGPGGRTYRYRSTGRLKGGQSWRIAYPGATPARAYSLARFQLSHHATLQTLEVVSNLLELSPQPWLFLTDRNGAKVSRSCFHSTKP